MAAWAIWTVLVAAINLTAFVAVRGRWGRGALALALVGLAGTAAGNAAGAVLGLDLLVLGEFRPLEASIGAQLLMIGTAAAAAVAGPRAPRDAGGRGR